MIEVVGAVVDLLIFSVKNSAETSRLRVPVSPRNETSIRDCKYVIPTSF